MTEDHHLEEIPVEPIIQTIETHTIVSRTPKPGLVWILFGFLFAGLLGIYILYFLKPNNVRELPPAAFYKKTGGITVAFVNSDTIKSKYTMVLEMQKMLEQKFATLDNELHAKQQALESKAADLQKKYDARQINQEEAAKQQELLQSESKKLYDLNQQYTSKMADEEGKMNNIFIDSIDHYLKRYNSTLKFDYILGYTRGGGILFAKDTLDITADVLKGLNEEYQKRQK
ncbi:MAG: OmpH family outer membrane protein [Bacteroidota bacterium]